MVNSTQEEAAADSENPDCLKESLNPGLLWTIPLGKHTQVLFSNILSADLLSFFFFNFRYLSHSFISISNIMKNFKQHN